MSPVSKTRTFKTFTVDDAFKKKNLVLNKNIATQNRIAKIKKLYNNREKNEENTERNVKVESE